MTQADQYGDQQQELARHLARKLRETLSQLRGTMSDHAIATALLGTGVELAVAYMPPADVADWLRQVADHIEARSPLDCAGSA